MGRNWVLPLVGLTLTLAIAAGCAGAAPTPTSTPSPTHTPVPTSTPSPTVTYVEGRFESDSTTGKEITVPVGSPVGVHVVLNATSNMRGELKVEVWKAIALAPDTSVQTCTKVATLTKGSQEAYACEFTAEGLTSRSFTHYYLKAYWNGVPLTVEPRIGEGVRTVPDHTTPTPTPTPLPTQEWNLEDIQVDSSTVTVSLRVFAGIDVWATLDGKRADEVNSTLPTIEYVFQNVTPGKHTVDVRDVVGHKETAEVVVPTSGIPEWLTGLIQRLDNEPVANPPASITQYEYRGQLVYFVPQRCCDIFSDLYDADGNIVGHPDGGITGQGDGRVPDFFEERKNERTIWQDKRTYDPNLVQALAPIESVEVLIMESFPVQYRVLVASGLPNACHSFAGYRLERSGDTIHIEMINWKPADSRVACAEVYGIVETTIPLGSDFESGKTYTIMVNNVTENFVAQ